VNTSVEIDKIAGALVAVQAAMKPAIKDATNPHFRSKYADLGAIWEACREPLTKNGIFVGQDVTGDSGCVAVTTRMIHTSGQWVEFGPLVIPLGRHDAQAVGSGVSYGKRYALAAALGIIAEDDDDGNTATASAPKPQPAYAQGTRKPATNGKEVANAAEAVTAERKVVAVISADQRKQLQKDAEQAGWKVDEVKDLLKGFGFNNSADITQDIFATISKAIHEGTGGREEAPF
jgi:hypothetical protein